MTQNLSSTVDASEICTLPLSQHHFSLLIPFVSHRRRPVHMMSLQTATEAGRRTNPFPSSSRAARTGGLNRALLRYDRSGSWFHHGRHESLTAALVKNYRQRGFDIELGDAVKVATPANRRDSVHCNPPCLLGTYHPLRHAALCSLFGRGV
ncbi:hypothetical protein BDP81DRAFT_182867 [Colletotrichum phormii]|uniref:Uncharacterized protein n=1 Tax=Colletotrichum phormii TaxID=359342 RepID=A0AAI9ZZE5_9PEZI|nr:uncharacterized protein BDP81DRAFT_182867 [Colletotrichum phormii]KAK1639738.1 hypothetical protein BDP81DRAFT_182867 [Colletotrichum phormii]